MTSEQRPAESLGETCRSGLARELTLQSAQIRRFNDSVSEELITLKIRAHVGPCLAVTLNERPAQWGG